MGNGRRVDGLEGSVSTHPLFDPLELGAQVAAQLGAGLGRAAEGNVALVKELAVWTEREKAAVAKLQELKDAGEASWETLKAGVEDAWAELRTAVEMVLHKH